MARMRWTVAAVGLLAACAPEPTLELEVPRPSPDELPLRAQFDTSPVASCLVISPPILGFGTVRLGCSRRAEFELLNHCTVTVPNLRLAAAGGPFALLAGTPSLSLAPNGSSGPLAITFAPMSPGRFDGVLQVTEPTGSADLAHLLALAGSGEEGGPVELRFRVEAGASGPSRTALFLPSRPAETPVVVPNEVAAGLAWTWDPVQNAIVFDTPPPEGSEFVVRYEEPCSP